jgi:hypothetical protein
VQYLQAREEAMGEPAVASENGGAVTGTPVAVGATRNGADRHEVGPEPVPVRLPHPAIRPTRSS